LVERLVYEGDLAWSVEDALRSVRKQLTPHLPPQPFRPNRQKIRYSDTNYLLLTAIIEAVSGQPLHRVYEERLFQPLKLQNTWLPATLPAALTHIRAGGALGRGPALADPSGDAFPPGYVQHG
jgi:CubicO group peptidase (beta-lactamase class C family)